MLASIRTGAALLAGTLALAGCAAEIPAAGAASYPSPTPAETASTPDSPTPAPPTPPAAPRPPFTATVQRLDDALQRRMRGISWRPGCPVGLRALRLLTLRYTTFRGGSRMGRLVLHRSVATDVVEVFRQLYDARYPIRRLVPVEAYDGSDRRSMRANNTSGFNCRRVSGSSSWSQHAYGLAIDINPVQNPYRRPGRVSPERGRRFVDRSVGHPAVIRAGDPVVRAFDSIGWGWGGRWSPEKDWQHFSRNSG